MKQYQVQMFLILVGVLGFALLTRLYAQDGNGNSNETYISGGLVWSPDSTHLAIGTSSGVWLHDVATLEPTIHFDAQTEEVTTLAWSSDGTMIAAGEINGSITIWSFVNGELLRTLEDPNAFPARYIVWGYEDELICVSTISAPIRVWDVASGSERSAFSPPGEGTFDLLAIPGTQDIIVNGILEISRWDVSTEEITETWNPPADQLTIDLNADDGLLAMGNSLGQVSILDINSGQIRRLPGENYTYIRVVLWTPDGDRILASGYRNEDRANREERQVIRIWNAETGELEGEFLGGIFNDLGRYHNAMAFSPDGEYLAGISDDGKIYLWDAETFDEVNVYDGYAETRLPFNP